MAAHNLASRTAQPTDLQDLVDNPRERLDAEYKSWIDLSEPVTKAKLARHLAALANHGGGYIIFGFSDKPMAPMTPSVFPLASYNSDALASIVKRYLEPSFECGVHVVRSSAGNDHPVVWVPSHPSTPIVARTNGPHDSTGKPQGIVQGSVYIRAPGPESISATTPAQWAELVRRCTLHDRELLISQLLPVLRDPGAVKNDSEILKTWHERAHARFVDELEKRGAPELLRSSHFQLSYTVGHDNGEALEAERLLQVIRDMNNETRDMVSTGWSMFYPFSRPGIEPYSQFDPEFGEFVETNLMADPVSSADRFVHPDFWRLTADGKATLLRGYFEDRPRRVQHYLTPGRWLSPFLLTRELVEIVRHARAFAERFETAHSIAFRCEFWGLSGREIADPDPDRDWEPGQVAKSDPRVVTRERAVADLIANLPSVVSQLVSPVTRAFNLELTVTEDMVRSWMREYRHV